MHLHQGDGSVHPNSSINLGQHMFLLNRGSEPFFLPSIPLAAWRDPQPLTQDDIYSNS